MGNMPSTIYIAAAIATAGLITLALRSLPFAFLKPLRKSKFVTKVGEWMPVGIMLILAAVTIRGSIVDRPGLWWATPVALVVTIGVHYLSKRKTLWSVGAGTACFVILVNVFG